MLCGALIILPERLGWVDALKAQVLVRDWMIVVVFPLLALLFIGPFLVAAIFFRVATRRLVRLSDAPSANSRDT